MSNKNNDAEKAIIQLGKIFKIFAVVAIVLVIALCIYLASNAKTAQSENYSAVNISKSTCESFKQSEILYAKTFDYTRADFFEGKIF